MLPKIKTTKLSIEFRQVYQFRDCGQIVIYTYINIRGDFKMMDIKVETIYGTYIGRKNENDVISFKGVPYAKPPVGNLRWKAPQKPDRGHAVIETYEFGPSCVQPIDEIETASLHIQGEDCLTLNIWTRETGEAQKPVMVYIHGGGYIGGGSSDPLYDGANFVKRHDIVFVSINYRCNVLGFMDLEEIGGQAYKDSKNLGILDQICALKWINENIHLFGGNAENITLFGESAGSGSVCLLLTAPGAKGLFHRAIAESGALIMHKKPEKAKEYTRHFLKHTGVDTIEKLLSLSADHIRDACVNLMEEFGYKSEIMFAPVADGRIIPFDPYESIRNGCAAGINLIVGTTAEELNYWKLYYDDIEKKIQQFMKDQFDVMPIDIQKYQKEMSQYLAIESELSLGDRYITLAGELMFRIPSIRLAELQSKYADTWMYIFEWPSETEGMGAAHGAELPFVFHNIDEEYIMKFIGVKPPESLGDSMQDAWVAFTVGGDPNHPGIPEWPQYEAENRYTAIINEKWRIEQDPGKEARLFLRRIFE